MAEKQKTNKQKIQTIVQTKEMQKQILRPHLDLF